MVRTASSGGCTHVYNHLLHCGQYVSGNDLAAELGLHIKTVRKAVRCLDALGLVHRDGSGIAVRSKVEPHVVNQLRAIAAGTKTFDTRTEMFAGPTQGSEPATPMGETPVADRIFVGGWVPRDAIGEAFEDAPVSISVRELPFADTAGSTLAPATEPAGSQTASSLPSRASTAVAFTNAVAVADAIADASAIADANNIAKANNKTLGGSSTESVERVAKHRAGGLGEEVPQMQLTLGDIADTQMATKAVFSHWKGRHPRALFSAEREGLIRKRLAEGFSVAQLCQVIDWAATDPFMSGNHPDAKRAYDDIPNLLGSSDKVARYLFQAERNPGRGRLASNMLPAADGAWAPATRE